MELNKEDIYINLQGKSKKELTELYWLLKNNNEKLYRDSLQLFLKYPQSHEVFDFCGDEWCGDLDKENLNKQEVTIQQLKDILQPTESLEQQLEKAKAEVKRIKKEIEESKIKIGDWFIEKSTNKIQKATSSISEVYLTNKNYCKKITDQELIKKLNNLIK